MSGKGRGERNVESGWEVDRHSDSRSDCPNGRGTVRAAAHDHGHYGAARSVQAGCGEGGTLESHRRGPAAGRRVEREGRFHDSEAMSSAAIQIYQTIEA